MANPLRRAVLALVFCLPSVPLIADDNAPAPVPVADDDVHVVGTLTAELDYRQLTWYLTVKDGESRSGFTGLQHLQGVELFGHASADTTSNVKESLRLSFEIEEVDGVSSVKNVSMSYMPGDLSSPYVAANPRRRMLRVDQHEVKDDKLIVSGTFAAELLFNDGFGQLLGSDASLTGGAGLIAGALTEAKRQKRDLEDGKFIAIIPRKQ
ncbi:MAG: hypothetical protein AAF416_07535 [Pseudomonadota bacterium]